MFDPSDQIESYYYVGALLRDALLGVLAATTWEGVLAIRADKIGASLRAARSHREGCLVDSSRWSWEDVDFLRALLVDAERLRRVVEKIEGAHEVTLSIHGQVVALQGRL